MDILDRLSPIFAASKTNDVSCQCVEVSKDLGHGSDLDSSVSRIIICKSVISKLTGGEDVVVSRGYMVVGETLILLESSLVSASVGGVSMHATDCVNAALFDFGERPIESSVDDCVLTGLVRDVAFVGELRSRMSAVLMWRPSDSPALKTPVRPSVGQIVADPKRRKARSRTVMQLSNPPHPLHAVSPPPHPTSTPDWVTRRTDTGALAELFMWHSLQAAYEPTPLPLSCWVSSTKRRFFPEDKTRVNDALGADFEFVDALGIFSKKKGALLRLEVKGSVRSEVTQFEISRNEMKGWAASNKGGCEYVVVLVAGVGVEGRSPVIYAVIRNLDELQALEPIQFLASFNLHNRRGLQPLELSTMSALRHAPPVQPEPALASQPKQPDSWITRAREGLESSEESEDNMPSLVDQVRKVVAKDTGYKSDESSDENIEETFDPELLFFEDTVPMKKQKRIQALSRSSYYPL